MVIKTNIQGSLSNRNLRQCYLLLTHLLHMSRTGDGVGVVLRHGGDHWSQPTLEDAQGEAGLDGPRWLGESPLHDHLPGHRACQARGESGFSRTKMYGNV